MPPLPQEPLPGEDTPLLVDSIDVEHQEYPAGVVDGVVRRQGRGVWEALGAAVGLGGNSRKQGDARAILEAESSDEEGDGKPVASWVHNVYSLPSIAIIMSYFSVGVVLEFIDVPVTMYLVQELGASSTQSAVYDIVTKLPWSFKVFFGFLSDAFPIKGLRRLPYLVIGWSIHVLCFVVLAVMGQPDTQWVIGLAFLSACGYLLSDVMTDSIMVERTKLESYKARGSVQASGYIARYFGAALGSLAGAVVYNKASWGWGLSISNVFLLNALVPLVCVFPFVPYLKETVKTHLPTGGGNVFRKHWGEIWSLVQKRAVWQPMTFVYVYNAMMIPNSAWNNFLIEGLNFSDFYLGVISIAGSVTAWLGLVLYKRFFMQANWRNVYLSTTLFNLVISVLQVFLILGWNKLLRIPDLIFAAGDDAADEFLLAMQFLPVVIMYASICPDGTEGTSYAMLTTLSNTADTIALVLGDMLTQTWDTSNAALASHEWGGLLNLTLFTSFIQLLPLLLLPLLPADKNEQRAMQLSSEKSWWGGAIFIAVTLGSILASIVQAIYEIYL